ncbi:MAG: hypothetical protein OHK0029_01280 [Armatimonadaceae bacterium]
MLTKNRFASFRTRTIAAASAGFLFALVSAGCGGSSSGGGSNTPGGNTRAAAVQAVQGVRQASGVLAFRSANSEASVSRAVRKGVRLNQITRAEDDNGMTGFDEEQGLYYQMQVSEQGFRINYFRDQARTQSAGYFEIVSVNETTTRLSFRISAGLEPVNGDMTMQITNAETGAGRITGNIQDIRTGERIIFDLTMGDNGSLAGNFTVNSAEGQIAFRNIIGSENGGIKSDIAIGNLNGTVEQNADESGVLRLTDATGTYVAQYNAAGQGTIKLPNGQVLNIADFDTAE